MFKGLWKRIIVWLMVLSISISSSGLQVLASDSGVTLEAEPQVIMEESDEKNVETLNETEDEEDYEDVSGNDVSSENGGEEEGDESDNEDIEDETDDESDNEDIEDKTDDDVESDEEQDDNSTEEDEALDENSKEEVSDDENAGAELNVSGNDLNISGEKEIQLVQMQNVGEAGTEDTVTLSYSSNSGDTTKKNAMRDALTAASSSVTTSDSGKTVTYTLNKSLLLNSQLNINKIGYSKVILLAEDNTNITIKRGPNYTGGNMIYLNGQSLIIGSSEGMSGTITIDGGAEVTVQEQSAWYENTTYTNNGLTAVKGLLCAGENSAVEIYGGVKLCNNAVYRSYKSLSGDDRYDYFKNGCAIGNVNGTLILDGCEITGNGYLAQSEEDHNMPLIVNYGSNANLVINDVNIHDNFVTGVTFDDYNSGNSYYQHPRGSGLIANFGGTATINKGTITESKILNTVDVSASVGIYNAGIMTLGKDVVIGNPMPENENTNYSKKGLKYGVLNSCGGIGNKYNYAKSTEVSLTVNGATIYPGIKNYGKLTINDGYIGCFVYAQNGDYDTSPFVNSLENVDSGMATGGYDEYNSNVLIAGGVLAGEVNNEGHLEMTGGSITRIDLGDSRVCGINQYTGHEEDGAKSKTILSGGTISGFDIGVRAYGLGEVNITGNVVIENNRTSGVEVEASNYRDYEVGDLDVIMTGGTIRGNGTYGESFTGAVSLNGDGGRFILSGGTITENKGWDGCAINYYKNMYYKGLYPYVVIRGGLVTKNFSSSGYQAEWPFNGGSTNHSQVKDGTVFLAHDVMTFEGVGISDVFKGNYSYREEDTSNDIVLTSYEELIAAFTPVEVDGVKIVTLDKNITVKGTIEIPENESVTLNASKNVMISRSPEFTGDLFRVSGGGFLTLNETATYLLMIDGGVASDAKSENAGVFYVEENANLSLQPKVKLFNHRYVHNENATQEHGALITNHGLCNMYGVTIENNDIEQDADQSTALIYNSGKGRVYLSQCELNSNNKENYNVAIDNAGTCEISMDTTISGFSLALNQENGNAVTEIEDTVIKDGVDAFHISGGSVTMCDGASIQYLDNVGVTLSGSGEFCLEGGEIQNCGYYAITEAAAIKMTSDDCALVVCDGTITSNEAMKGAAIHRSGKGLVTFAGGQINGNYSTFDDGNKSGVAGGAFYSDSSENIVWQGIAASDVFYDNYVEVIPSRYGTDKTIKSQSDFNNAYPITVINGKRVRFLHDNVYLTCTINVTGEETWIPLNDTIIYKYASLDKLICVKDGANLTLGDTSISDKMLTIDGQGTLTKATAYSYPVTRGSGSYLKKDSTLISILEGAVVNVTDKVVIQKNVSYTDRSNKTLNDSIVVGSAITNCGTLNLKGGLITKNALTYHMDRESVSLYLEDRSGYMPCILNKGENATLNLSGTIIEENVVGGAAVLANYGGTVVMTGGQILAHNNDGGYQLLVKNEGEFIMQGGEIRQAEYRIGNLYQANPEAVFSNSKNMLMENGIISGTLQNYNSIEGEIPVFSMQGGTLQSYNSDTFMNSGNAFIEGGNIYIHSVRTSYYSKPTLAGHNIIYNAASTNAANLKVTGGNIAFKDGFDEIDDYPERWPRGIYNSEGKVELSNITLSKCQYALYDRGQSVLSNCTLTENRIGIKISGTNDTAKTTLSTGCIVEDNNIGLEVSGESNVFIEDGAIIRRNRDYGVDLQDGIVTMNGGQIRNNNNGYYGRGGVCLRYGTPKFIMNGGQIRGNHGQDGAAIYASAGTVELNGGQITKNYCNSYYWDKPMEPGLADKTVYIDKQKGAKLNINENVKAEDIIKGNFYGSPKQSYISSAKYYLFMTPGQQASLEAVVYGDDELSYRVKSGEGIVSVDNTGMVTAIKPGSATISIKCVDSGAELVTTVEVKDYFMEPAVLSLGRGQSQKTVLMERKTVNNEEVVVPADAAVEWSTNNENIVSITKDADGNYYATGEGNGNAEISAVVQKKYSGVTGKIQVTIPVTVTVAVREVTLNKYEAALMEDDSQILQAYVVPYDTDDVYTLQWVSSDNGVVTVEPNARGDMATIQAVAKGTADVTVKVLVNGEVRTENTCQVSVTALGDVPQLETIYVLTNHSDRLSEVELPDGYTWKEARKGEAARTKLKASAKPQTFTASYADDENKVYGDVEVTLYVGTISGFEISGDTLLETGTENKGSVTIKPILKGSISKEQLWGNQAMEGKLTFAHAVNGDSLLKITGDGANESPSVSAENNSATYHVEALEAACGKNVSVKFRMALAGADTDNTSQRGELWFEKTFRIKVVKKDAAVAEEINLNTDVFEAQGINFTTTKTNQVLTLIADVDDLDPASFTLPIVVENKAAEDVTAKTKLSFTSSRRNVATVSSKGVVTVKKPGVTLITVTAKDGSEEKLSFYLDFRSYKPRVADSQLELNVASQKGAVSKLYLTEGSQLRENEPLTLYCYNSESGAYEEALASELFVINRGEDNKFVITATEVLKENYSGSKVYPLMLTATVTVDGVDKEYGSDKGIYFKVKVVERIPQVEAAQTEQANLFYLDEMISLEFEVNDELIQNISLTDNSVFEISNREISGSKAKVILMAKNDAEWDETEVNCEFAVSLQGYENTFNVEEKVRFQYQEPALGFENGEIVILPDAGLMTGTDILMDKTVNQPMDLQDVQITAGTENVVIQKGREAGSITFALLEEFINEASDVIELTLTHDNWREDITLTENVVRELPDVTLSKPEIVLSNTQDLSKTAAQEAKLQIAADVESLTVKDIQPKDAKTKNMVEKALLVARKDGSSILTGLQVIMKKGVPQIASKGTYSFEITPEVVIAGGADAIELAPVILTVKVTEGTPTVTLKGSGRFNLLDRSKGNTFNPVVTNTSLGIKRVVFKGTDANKFTAVYENGKVKVSAKEGVDFELRKNYLLIPHYTMEDGSVIIGRSITLTPYEPTIRVKNKSRETILYRGAWGIQNGTKVELSASALGQEVTIANVKSLTKGFAYDANSGMLYVSNPYILKEQNRKKVTLSVEVEGQATNSKRKNVTVTVNVME